MVDKALNSQDSKVNETYVCPSYKVLLYFHCDFSLSSFIFGSPVVKLF